MKVVELTAAISKSSAGVWEVVCQLSGALVQAPDMQVSVIGLEHRDSVKEGARLPSGIVRPVPAKGPAAFGYAPGMREALAATAPDVVHCHGLWMYPSVAGAAYAAASGARRIVSPHGMLDPWAVRHRRWKKWLATTLYEGRALKTANALHALCAAEREAIRRFGLSNPVFTIPNGIDLPDGQVRPKPWPDEWQDGRNVLLYLGRIHPKKGLHFMLDGLGKMMARGSRFTRDWGVVVVGWGDPEHESALRRQVSELGLYRVVHLAGPLFGDDKAAAYQNADAFILPSQSEGLPMVVLEAWANELPALITPHCNLPEGVEAGAAIEMMDASDDVARALEQLSGSSAEERQAMGRRARALVEARFTWEAVSKQMVAAYNWLLGGADAPETLSVQE